MMKILILDDDSARHVAFAEHYASNEIIHVFNYAGAVFYLDRNVFDLVHLDHDLEDYYYDGDYGGKGAYLEMTGMDVVRHIINMVPSMRPKRAIVHSWNVGAGPSMAANLNSNGIPAVYQPFSYYLPEQDDRETGG